MLFSSTESASIRTRRNRKSEIGICRSPMSWQRNWKRRIKKRSFRFPTIRYRMRSVASRTEPGSKYRRISCGIHTPRVWKRLGSRRKSSSTFWAIPRWKWRRTSTPTYSKAMLNGSLMRSAGFFRRKPLDLTLFLTLNPSKSRSKEKRKSLYLVFV